MYLALGLPRGVGRHLHGLDPLSRVPSKLSDLRGGVESQPLVGLSEVLQLCLYVRPTTTRSVENDTEEASYAYINIRNICVYIDK